MKTGIIGGSGLYDLDGLEDVRPVRIETPFGDPSDEYMHGRLGGHEVFFLPRHGRGHRLMPSEINHRANIFGFKLLGVERVISVSAVGSLREDFRPGDIVLPDQYFDRTKQSRAHTFFGDGIVAHVAFGHPVCNSLRSSLHQVCKSVASSSATHGKSRIHNGGTYVNMEGPAFSTRAESEFYRKQGFDVIGMTSLAEAKLCREAQICYSSMAMVTDYDCWHVSSGDVTVEMVVETLKANVSVARAIVRQAVLDLPDQRDCGCASALRHAIISAPDIVSAEARKRLQPIIGQYLP